MFASNIEKRFYANGYIKDPNVAKLIEENDCISFIEPLCDIKTKALLEISFCKENKTLMEDLIKNGLKLNDGTKIDVKINLEQISRSRRKFKKTK